MTTPQIKLIATDMDGTLLNGRREISPANIRAIEKAQALGVRVALCSGRSVYNAASTAIRNGLRGFIVLGLNGAHCAMSVDEEPYEDIRMNDAAFKLCVERLKSLGGKLVCFAPRTVITLNAPKEKGFEHYGADDRDVYPTEQLYGIEALERITSASKMVYVDEDTDRLSRAEGLVSGIAGIDITSSWSDNIEIMPAGMNKGAALRRLVERLGISMSEVMAFGDYDNDISMIESAGFGIAMGNANEKVKGAARYTTDTNDNDGLALAIERFVL